VILNRSLELLYTKKLIFIINFDYIKINKLEINGKHRLKPLIPGSKQQKQNTTLVPNVGRYGRKIEERERTAESSPWFPPHYYP